MMLGQLIQRVLRAQDLYLDQLGVQDIVLLSRVEAAAGARGVSIRDFVAEAIHRLLNSDDDAVWTTLMGKLQGSETPGLSFIDMAVRRHLDTPPVQAAPSRQPPTLSSTPAAPLQRTGGCGGGGGCGCNG